MSMLRRITNLFHRSKLDQEIEAELRSHIEMRTADNLAAGMSPQEARRDALLRFGNRAVLKERVTAADAQMFLNLGLAGLALRPWHAAQILRIRRRRRGLFPRWQWPRTIPFICSPCDGVCSEACL